MIAENIAVLKEKVAGICAKNGRNFSDIKIIAVSKNFGTEEILKAAHEGLIDFGENKAQELISKTAVIQEKLIWHFLGHLQRNKVRFAVDSADYIHSVDSLLIATEINKRAEKMNKNINILLQVKTSDEDTKSGITEESEVLDLAGYCKEFKNVTLAGLMTIAPYTDDRSVIRRSFRYLFNLKEKLKNDGIDLKELSMGMTHDYDIAIEEGSTMLRIGTAIFGERDYSKNGANN